MICRLKHIHNAFSCTCVPIHQDCFGSDRNSSWVVHRREYIGSWMPGKVDHPSWGKCQGWSLILGTTRMINNIWMPFATSVSILFILTVCGLVSRQGRKRGHQDYHTHSRSSADFGWPCSRCFGLTLSHRSLITLHEHPWVPGAFSW